MLRAFKPPRFELWVGHLFDTRLSPTHYWPARGKEKTRDPRKNVPNLSSPLIDNDPLSLCKRQRKQHWDVLAIGLHGFVEQVELVQK